MAFVFVGCGPSVRSVRVGPQATPLPETCGAEVARITLEEARAKGMEVGVVCVASAYATRDGADSADVIQQDPEAYEALRARACVLGGTVIVPSGLCANGSGRSSREGVEFAVFRPSAR